MYLVNHPTNGVFPSKRDIPRLVGSEVSEKSLIALIDDDLSVLTSLKLLLELEGHQVIASTNINDLMILIQSYESIPSLIVADYRLEESENGINAVTKIRNYANQHIPALVITGGVSSALEKLAHRPSPHAGFFHLLAEVEVVFAFWSMVMLAVMGSLHLKRSVRVMLTRQQKRHMEKPLRRAHLITASHL